MQGTMDRGARIGIGHARAPEHGLAVMTSASPLALFVLGLAALLPAQTNWVQVNTLGQPDLAAMAYDAARGRVVLFGGSFANGTYSADTWEYDGQAWRLRVTTNRPSGRGGHAMSYDAARGRVVLFGGSASTTLRDTWE